MDYSPDQRRLNYIKVLLEKQIMIPILHGGRRVSLSIFLVLNALGVAAQVPPVIQNLSFGDSISSMVYSGLEGGNAVNVILLDGDRLFFPALGVLSYMRSIDAFPACNVVGLEYENRYDLLVDKRKSRQLTNVVDSIGNDILPRKKVILIGHSLSVWWVLDNFETLDVEILGLLMISPYLNQKLIQKIRSIDPSIFVFIASGKEDLPRHFNSITAIGDLENSRHKVELMDGYDHNALVLPSITAGIKFMSRDYAALFNHNASVDSLYSRYKELDFFGVQDYYQKRAALYGLEDDRVSFPDLNALANIVMLKSDTAELDEVSAYMVLSHPSFPEPYFFRSKYFEWMDDKQRAFESFKAGVDLLDTGEVSNLEYFQNELARLKLEWEN